RAFVAKTCPPERAKEWDEQGVAPEELFRGLAELGRLDLAFPEADGGGGGRARELVILAAELGRASLDISMCYIGTLISGLTAAKFGTPEQKAEYLPAIASGARRLAIGISEPDAGSDAAAMRTRAADKGDHFVVTGQKMWCTGAGLPNTHI